MNVKAINNAAPINDWHYFIGIDWSGAKGITHQGIQLAIAQPGRGAPVGISPPDGTEWSREAVRDYLVELVSSGTGSILVGIDFAFAHPFHDLGSYFPGQDISPATAAELWQLVEDVNKDNPHLYGGAMFTTEPWGDYYLAPPAYGKGAPFYQSRRRMAETACREAGRSPSPTFKAVGADNVATGSMAGMRLLHQLRSQLGAQVAMWPFDDLDAVTASRLTLVEIFPSYHFHRVGYDPAKQAARDSGFMSDALAAYDSDGVSPDYMPRGRDADEADAMIAAAALRFFAPDHSYWQRPEHAKREGWIFGVPTI
ncbi:MAG: hypothetical protein ACPID2_05975 [Candidatus Puniceispirillum sp.]